MAEVKSDCRFCRPAEPERIVFRSENFYVMASLGSLVPGHLMIIPIVHHSCSGELPEELIDEFARVRSWVECQLMDRYQASFFFEHGRSGACLPEGHGEDHCFHAHIHYLPLCGDVPANVANVVKESYPGLTLEGWAEVRKAYKLDPRPYILIQDGSGIYLSVTASKLPRHYLRTVVADCIGSPELADWVAAPNYSVISATLNKFGAFADNMPEGD